MYLEYEKTMKDLLKLVVRTFYEPYHVVITDILLENTLLSDTEFCSKMKMLNREFSKLIIRLKDDKLIKSDTKVENKEDNKQILKNVYFFNYVEVRDVIKYKIFKMTQALEIEKVSEDEVFYCKTCEKYFSALDAQALIEDFVFKCIFCRNELQENMHKNTENSLDLKELLSNIKNIIKLLKEAEKYEIPSMDYFQILELKKSKEKNQMNTIESNSKSNQSTRLKIDNSIQETESEEFNVVSSNEDRKSSSFEHKEIVTINGIPKPFTEVTEDDKELMNEEEYTKYFEIYSKYQ